MNELPLSEQRRVAETVRAACVEAALRGYRNAALSGLCHEGAMECAIGAMRNLDMETLLREAQADSTG